MKVVKWESRIDTVLDAMPGTSADLAIKTVLGIGAVQKSIRILLKQKRCFQAIRHDGSLAHTFVYYEMKHWKRIMRKRLRDYKKKSNA